MNNVWVVSAFFNFGDGNPAFAEVVGVAGDSMRAFHMLESYDYKEVIRSSYEMNIEETETARREIGINRKGKPFYEERRTFKYQLLGEDAVYPVDVTFAICEV